MMLKQWIKRIFSLSGFTISMIVTALMFILYVINTFSPANFLNLMDKKWVDLLMKNRGTIEHSDQVVIAAVDTKTIDRYGRWPLPRQTYATMLTSLRDHYQVSTVGFDIVFSEADNKQLQIAQKYRNDFLQKGLQNSPAGELHLEHMQNLESSLDGDQILGQELSQTPAVVLGYVFFSNEAGLEHLTDDDFFDAEDQIMPHAIFNLSGEEYLYETWIPEGVYPEMSILKITENSHLGSFNVLNDMEDGVVRRIHSIWRFQGRYYPVLTLKMLANHLQADIEVHADEEGIRSIQVGEKELFPDASGAFAINYKGKEKTFPHYSMVDIIERTLPIEALRNKLVLVGVTEVGVLDTRITPVSETYPGVEVHASLLDNWLTGTYFRTDLGNQLFTLGLMLGFGLIIGIIVPKLNLEWGLAFVIALLVGYTLLHQYFVNVILSWPSFVYVFLTILLCSVTVIQYMFFISDKDKRFIKKAFQSYLSPEVIHQMLENPAMLKLGGEEKELTALFSDVAGFSSISEKLTPPELVALLNIYLTEMSDTIMKYDGTVDKFEGDAIIAFFGAPLTVSDHAARGALVCLEMQSRIAQLRQQWKEEGKVELFHRIAINTGQMVVGNMGSRNRMDYTIMGNSVNLAARLEGANKMYGTELMMSEMTFAQCKDAVEGRELDQIRVVGINQPIKIYEIVSKRGELRPNQEKGFATFEQGIELYRQQEWEKAQEWFTNTLEYLPADGPANIFIQRCQQYQIQPPPSDWDGVFTATSK